MTIVELESSMSVKSESFVLLYAGIIRRSKDIADNLLDRKHIIILDYEISVNSPISEDLNLQALHRPACVPRGEQGFRVFVDKKPERS